MQGMSENFEEYHLRWRKIEQVCGFSIITTGSSPPSSHALLPSATSHNSTPVYSRKRNMSLTFSEVTSDNSLGVRSISLPTDVHRPRYSSGDVLADLPSHISAPSNLNRRVDYPEAVDHHATSRRLLEKDMKKHHTMQSNSSLGIIMEASPSPAQVPSEGDDSHSQISSVSNQRHRKSLTKMPSHANHD